MPDIGPQNFAGARHPWHPLYLGSWTKHLSILPYVQMSHFHFFQFLQSYHKMLQMKVAWHVLRVKNMYLVWVTLRPLGPHRALSATRFYAVRLYAVCMWPFRHSQQERSVCTAAVQPTPNGLYQVECAVRAYCPTIILCVGVSVFWL